MAEVTIEGRDGSFTVYAAAPNDGDGPPAPAASRCLAAQRV